MFPHRTIAILPLLCSKANVQPLRCLGHASCEFDKPINQERHSLVPCVQSKQRTQYSITNRHNSVNGYPKHSTICNVWVTLVFPLIWMWVPLNALGARIGEEGLTAVWK